MITFFLTTGCVVFWVTALYADIFYTPGEYQTIVNDRNALQLTLNDAQDQWLAKEHDLEVKIAGLNIQINILNKQLAESRNTENSDRKTVEDLKTQNIKMRTDYERQLEALKKLAEAQKADLVKMSRQAGELEHQLEAEIKNGDIKVNSLSNKIVININDRISFDSGFANLKPGVKAALDKIMGVLRNYPENKISVEGHTDNVPIRIGGRFRDNWQLSSERALSVLEYLLAKSRLTPDRFYVAGFGEFGPQAPNDTPENRAQNRRVDIVVVPEIKLVSAERK